MAESIAILDLENALADMADDREIYEEVVTVFLSDSPNTLSEISAAYTASDVTTVNRLAHSIKSASRSIGGLRLGSVAESLESESSDSCHPNIAALIHELTEEFKLLQQKLAEEGFVAELTK